MLSELIKRRDKLIEDIERIRHCLGNEWDYLQSVRDRMSNRGEGDLYLRYVSAHQRKKENWLDLRRELDQVRDEIRKRKTVLYYCQLLLKGVKKWLSK